MKYLLFLLLFSTIACTKDPNWYVVTDITIYKDGNKCGAVSHHITDGWVMSYEDRTKWENDHIFSGWMKLDSGFNYVDLYYADFWNKKNITETGNYFVISNCHAITAYCPER